MVPALIVLASLTCGGATYWLLFRRQPSQEPVYLFRCSDCGQKLRYLARKAGNEGMCPRCRNHCIFPAVSQDTADETALADRNSLARTSFGRVPANRL